MAEIIGVRFKKGGKIYYFQPNEEELEVGSFVIVDTVRGTECGEVVMERREIDDSGLNRELKTIIRKATPEDLKRVEDNKVKAKRAFDICNEKIKAHGLQMNLLEVEYTFDGNKILFNFSADGRVDFRELVKDLAGIFRSRIELRQIGVRDEAKMLGGLGICGRPFCCKQFMGDFQSVSIKMAKEQGLSLNPVKISGTCGRLMCCLTHEQDVYEDLMRTTPSIGSTVSTVDGEGVVVDRELIAGRVKVRLNDTENVVKAYYITDLLEGKGCKCGRRRMSFSEEPAADELSPSPYDIGETPDELAMLSELEELEHADENVTASRKSRGGRSSSHSKRPRSGSGSHDRSDNQRKNAPYGERKNGTHHSGNHAGNVVHKSEPAKGKQVSESGSKGGGSRNRYKGKNHQGKPHQGRRDGENHSSGSGQAD